MGSQSYQYPSPSYESQVTFAATDEDWPGPRCGHTLTAVFANNCQQLLLFGGSTTTAANGSLLHGISLTGVTNSVHRFDILTRTWTRLNPDGEVPSPRACHAAASFGPLLLIQGGIGPSGPSNRDVYMLDMASNDLKWHKMMVHGAAPGPRYGHVMDIAALRWLIIFGGTNGNEFLSHTWALDMWDPSSWDKLYPYGNEPSWKMYASASAREDGIFLLCGGSDSLGVSRGDTYALKMNSIAECRWILVPGVAPSPRFQHTAVCEGTRMHVIGGVLNRVRLVNGEAIVSVLNTETGEWSTSGSNRQNQYQLMQRCHHAAASVGNRIYVHGGIRADMLLRDFLVAKISDPSSSEVPSFMRRSSLERLAEVYNLPTVETAFYDNETERPVPLQERAETVGNRGGLVRTVRLDRFSNERRQNNGLVPHITKHNSLENLHKKVILRLLKPKDWKLPAERSFFLSRLEVEYLCNAVEQILVQEPTVLQLKVPIKVFGNLHGHFEDLMRLFREYGSPSVGGDITHIDYLFLGDYVDRGKHSLETIMLLLALKIEYPKNIHLIRGCHESCETNGLHGFLGECKERMGETDGLRAWFKINRLFNYLPLGAVVENKIFCVHGGIGRAVSLEEIASIRRPVYPESPGSTVLKDILSSGPTENDSVMGIKPHARGEGVISFGPDMVKRFCDRNNLEIIIRSHECVFDGVERFAKGQLITVFSATNYYGVAKNAGAILVIGRDLVIHPRVIHPDPLLISSSANSPDKEELNAAER